MKFLELYIATLVMWSMDYVMGCILFEYKEKPQHKKLIPIILIVSLLVTLINIANTKIFGGIIKIILIYITIYCFYSYLFNKNSSQTLVGSLILYLALFISEVIVAIIISGVLYFLKYPSMVFLKNTIFINCIITFLSYSIIKLNRKKLLTLVYNSNFEFKSGFVISILILITTTILLFKIPLSNWNLNMEFLLTMLLLLCFTLIGFLMLKQKADIQKTTSMYQKLAAYSDITNELLEDYRVISHEQKNQLLVIRSLLDDNSPQELVDYVDGLLDKKVGFKYEWIGDLNYLPLPGLKGLINYKLIEANSLKINTNISISKDIDKLKLNKLSSKQKDELYSIIGVYLDNAIQAAKESNKKEVSLEIYKEEEKIVTVIANTYNGKIEMEKLDNYGYTTKGKNHGVGLHLVKKIIENEVIYSQSRSLFEDYYVQKLIIDLSGIE